MGTKIYTTNLWKILHIATYHLCALREYNVTHNVISVATVARLMGHTNPTMILTHYQYVMNSQKRNASEFLPNLSCMARLYGAKKRTHSRIAVSP